MKALVTGGAGLIGSHIVDAALKRGYEVKIIDNLDEQTHPQGRPDWISNEVEFIHGDMRNRSEVDRALTGVDVVFHQAAFGGFTSELSKYAESNSVGTVMLFEAIRQKHFPVQKIVLASSQAIYGEGLYECPQHSQQQPGPRSVEQLERAEWEIKCPQCSRECKSLRTPEWKSKDGTTIYALTKRSQEEWGIALGRQLGIPVVATRYAVTYGPRQSIFNPYTGVVSIFSTRLLNGKPAVLYEDGQQTRDFIYVGDVAAANLFLMETPEANWQALNVGTGRATTVTQLVETLCRAYNLPVSIEKRDEFRPGDSRHVVHDPSRLNGLGFFANTTIAQGVQHYVEWIQTRQNVKEYFTEAEQTLKKMQVVRSVKA